jgi:DNA-binding beta-propeller fold protein YncE
MLAVLSVLLVNYLATRRFGSLLSADSSQTLVAPSFLFAFSGPPADAMVKPTGVLIDGNQCYVTDWGRGVIDVFDLNGKRLAVWGKGRLGIPLYLAKNPKNGNLYVTDRRLRKVFMFGPGGKYLGAFDPKLPKNQLPNFDTHGVQWAPLAIGFAPDGTMFVTEILKGHRLLVFDPNGKFKASVGDLGMPPKDTDGPAQFQFPNMLKVKNGEVWIADSNNRRMQVFDKTGKFLKMVPTGGLPRGFDFLLSTPGSNSKTPARFAVVDTLSHDVTIWDVTGAKLVTFGGQGVTEGLFSFPDGLGTDGKSRMYIADTSNARVQVWGWPQIVQPIPVPNTPQQWAWCLSPLLLLPLLLLFRKRKFFATTDFVQAMADAGEVDLMANKKMRWFIHEGTLDDLAKIVVDDKPVTEMIDFTEVPHSESDAKSYQERFEIDSEHAQLLSAGSRTKVMCTEDKELRRLARLLEVDVANREEFVERFAEKKAAEAEAEA